LRGEAMQYVATAMRYGQVCSLESRNYDIMSLSSDVIGEELCVEGLLEFRYECVDSFCDESIWVWVGMAARAAIYSARHASLVGQDVLILKRASASRPSAEGIMASGCAALTGRTHGCTDQPANVKKSLANPEPSTHGTKRT
jgi:hypothetical protein